MKSILRSERRRNKKKRRFGKVTMLSREAYAELDLDLKVETICSLVPLGLMHVQEVLDEEIDALASGRYTRKGEETRGRRHGSNPGSVPIAGQRVPLRVPRIRRAHGGEIPLQTYAALKQGGAVNDVLLKRVLYGISCRNYEAAAEAILGASGLSSSTVSRHGMVVALGITLAGEKRFLGFIETDTENETVLTPFVHSLLDRGLDISQGILVLLDGGKGLRAAVRKAFRGRAVVQRCQWHKLENVVRYLAKGEQAAWRKRLQCAYHRPTYTEASAQLMRLYRELDDRNQSAAGSLAEGMEETLTLHRLGVYSVLGRSLKTTNCIESVNALVEERCAKIDHWTTSNQRQRWLATALLDIEPRLRKIQGYRHLPKLRVSLRCHLKIERKDTAARAA